MKPVTPYSIAKLARKYEIERGTVTLYSYYCDTQDELEEMCVMHNNHELYLIG